MISIVTGYYNRKKLFRRTLLTIRESAVQDFEVIAVDDGSRDEERLEDLAPEFPFLKVIRLEKEHKWYKNPCIPFNVGFRQAAGDQIIIQNPECMHLGDVMRYVSQNLTHEDYLAFACYSLSKETTDSLDESSVDQESLRKNIAFENRVVTYDGDSGWYNHPVYRPAAWHFCSAISRRNLESLGGFDERYALGRMFDDVELLYRIERMGLNVKIVEEPLALHQNHYVRPQVPPTEEQKAQQLEHLVLRKRNEVLYQEVTRAELPWRVNVLDPEKVPALPVASQNAAEPLVDRIMKRGAKAIDRFKRRFSDIRAAEARRLSELESENRRLRKTVANQALDIEMLKEAAGRLF